MATCIIMPTVPRRVASANEVVRRLLPQTDCMIVHLNGHTEVPRWARDRRVRLALHPPGTGPISRLSLMPDSAEYVFFVDDDLRYPTNYVARSVDALARLGPKHAICYHGSRWPKGAKLVDTAREVIPYSASVAKDLPVTYMGSGTAGFHRSTLLRLDRAAPKMFEYEDDVWTSAACARKGIRMTRVSSPANWIVPLATAYDAGALYRNASSSAYVHRNKALKAAFAMGGWNPSL